ncbi:MFS general substrate transporter [Viridothelium virens]|uniref:MFS general substrate transporter n=1 Tax=Viridothelium virens TaxID=1048519 RepID=A0A6A6HN57_VIRVR|nr:MFS general substrate transporter [Viridothelium virens]
MPHHDERRPLLQEEGEEPEIIRFGKEDSGNPKAWPRSKKLANIAVIAMMAILSPLASSMFTPGINQIADDLGTSMHSVIGATTGFTVMLGFGPLVLAPLSETFGRRRLYMVCFTIFTLLQIPTALSPNVETLIAMRTVAGAFGSVGISNGGGTISDMFEPHERAGIFGWYLLGPLLGPTIGPLFGGLIVQRLNWRWIFWILAIVCGTNTLAGFIFLKETYAPVLLDRRRREYENDGENDRTYRFEGQDDRPLSSKLAASLMRPIKIFIQPIVLTMSLYQALVFGTTYSLYTNMQNIYSGIYGLNTEQVGLLYLFPGVGFVIAVRLLVPRIDTVYNALTKRNKGEAKPEYRLPLANIGAVLIPVSLFWFAWTVEYQSPWPVSIVSTLFYGIGQVMIINCVQNYYIDSFEKYAASAIAAGAVFRSVVGGITPLFAPLIFEKLGYGWGISVFAFLSVLIAPAPLIFYRFGGYIRERFHIEL